MEYYFHVCNTICKLKSEVSSMWFDEDDDWVDDGWRPEYDDEFLDDAIASEYEYGNGNFDDGFDYDFDGDDDIW